MFNCSCPKQGRFRLLNTIILISDSVKFRTQKEKEGLGQEKQCNSKGEVAFYRFFTAFREREWRKKKREQ